MSASPMPGTWHQPFAPSPWWQRAVARQAKRERRHISLATAAKAGHRAWLAWLWWGGRRRRPDEGTDFVGREGGGSWGRRGCRGAASPVGRPVACTLDIIEVQLAEAWEQVGVRLRDVGPSLPLAGGQHGLQSDLVSC